MSKSVCGQCNHVNSSYIKWCLNCGSYCADFEKIEVSQSVTQAIDDLFEAGVSNNTEKKVRFSEDRPTWTKAPNYGKEQGHESVPKPLNYGLPFRKQFVEEDHWSNEDDRGPGEAENSNEFTEEFDEPSTGNHYFWGYNFPGRKGYISERQPVEDFVKPVKGHIKKEAERKVGSAQAEGNLKEIPTGNPYYWNYDLLVRSLREDVDTSQSLPAWLGDLKKPTMPAIETSASNPYYSRKKELDDFMKSSLHWDSCYESVSLRESFMVTPQKESEHVILQPRFESTPEDEEESHFEISLQVEGNERPQPDHHVSIENEDTKHLPAQEAVFLPRQVVASERNYIPSEPEAVLEDMVNDVVAHQQPVPVIDLGNEEPAPADRLERELLFDYDDDEELPGEESHFSNSFDHYRTVSPVPLRPTIECGEFFQVTPRIHQGESSLLLSLPAEMLLYILSLLSQTDLTSVMAVCSRLHRFALDQSLWQWITIRNKPVQDDWLVTVGQRQPRALNIVCCDGANVSSAGLAEVFRLLQNRLVSFTMRASSRGALDTDNVVLRLASKCGPTLVSLNLAWTHVTDTGLAVIGASFPRLLHLDLSGCQAITDSALGSVVEALGKQLQTLVLCQNAKLTQQSFDCIASNCTSLERVELNSFAKLTDAHVSAICVASSRTLRWITLEYCKKVSEFSLLAIAESCSSLESLNLAKNRQLSRHAIGVIGANLAQLKHVNLSRLSAIEDADLKLLAEGCRKLESADLSRLPKITPEGVLAFVAACPTLRAVTLTGCAKVASGDKDFFKQNTSHSIAIVI